MTDKSHLLRFGYAPGNYWFVCRDCGSKHAVGDKRSTRCEACAESLHAQITSVEAVADKHRAMTTLPEEAVKAAATALANYIGHGMAEKCVDKAKEALTAALPFLPVQGAVKKLEWGNARITEDGREAEDAESPVGRYIATDTGWFLLGRTGYEVERGLYQAKAAAQQDYEARILSALEPFANSYPQGANLAAHSKNENGSDHEPSPREQGLETVGWLWEYAQYRTDDRGYYGYETVNTENSPTDHVSPAEKLRNVRELCIRSQAEELLAAERARYVEASQRATNEESLKDTMHRGLLRWKERAEKAEANLEFIERVKGVNEKYANALAFLEMGENDDPEEFAERFWNKFIALEADNAAKDAWIIEVENSLADAKDIARNASSNSIYWRGQTEALEAKLAAAQKALEPFALEAANWCDTVPDSHRSLCTEPGSKTAHPGSETTFTVGDLRRARAVLGGKPS
ncbi:hypothetical protein [Brucella anthropi]